MKTKKLLTTVLLVVLVAAMTVPMLFSAFSVKAAEPATEVDSAQELQDALAADKDVKLVGDVNLGGFSWTRVEQYSKTLDGAGFKIYGYSDTEPMFGELKSTATIKDAIFENFSVYATVGDSSIIVKNNRGLIENVRFNRFSLVAAENGSGGIFINNYGTLRGVSLSGTISGKDWHGGFGRFNYGTIDQCINFAEVVSTGNTSAGFVHTNGTATYTNAIISNSINYGNIQGTHRVSGFAGRNSYGKYTNCLNVGSVYGTMNLISGIEHVHTDGNQPFGTRFTNCYTLNTSIVKSGTVVTDFTTLSGYNGTSKTIEEISTNSFAQALGSAFEYVPGSKYPIQLKNYNIEMTNLGYSVSELKEISITSTSNSAKYDTGVFDGSDGWMAQVTLTFPKPGANETDNGLRYVSGFNKLDVNGKTVLGMRIYYWPNQHKYCLRFQPHDRVLNQAVVNNWLGNNDVNYTFSGTYPANENVLTVTYSYSKSDKTFYVMASAGEKRIGDFKITENSSFKDENGNVVTDQNIKVNMNNFESDKIRLMVGGNEDTNVTYSKHYLGTGVNQFYPAKDNTTLDTFKKTNGWEISFDVVYAAYIDQTANTIIYLKASNDGQTAKNASLVKLHGIPARNQVYSTGQKNKEYATGTSQYAQKDGGGDSQHYNTGWINYASNIHTVVITHYPNERGFVVKIYNQKTGKLLAVQTVSDKTETGWPLNNAYDNFLHFIVRDEHTKGISVLNYKNISSVSVSYNSNGGSGNMNSQTVDNQMTTVLAQNTFERVGYTFKGWNSKADGSGASFVDKQVIVPEDDVTLYAVWEANKYNVSFDANGGEGTMADQEFTFGVAAALTQNSFTREGYTFKGWATSANGAVAYENGADYTIGAENVTLYAVWEAKTYKVSFNANGGEGTMADQEFTFNVPAALTQNSFTRTGYTFKGWATSANGAVAYENSANYTIGAEDVTLYAVWELNKYEISFDANGGQGSMNALDADHGVNVTLTENAFTREGWQFSGWNTKADGSGTAYANKAEAAFTADTELFAQWTKIYTITFAGNGSDGGSMSSVEVLEGDIYMIPGCGFTKTDCVFAKWNTKADGSGTDYVLSQQITANEDLTLYAQWNNRPAYQYTVNFDANGGTGTMADQIYIENVPAALSENLFTREGYIFKCWNTKADGTGEDYEDGKILTYIGQPREVTFYAVWVEVYDVTFDPDNGTSETVLKTDVEGKISASFAPTLEGYNFLGWYIGNEKVDFATKVFTTDTTVTAKWEKIEYTVSFDAAEGTLAGDASAETEDGKVEAPADPTREGYNFLGWYIGNEKVDFATKVFTADTTVTAKWEKIEYTVSFDAAEGTLTGADELDTVNGKVVAPTAPTRDGYNFLGWYIGNEKVDFATKVFTADTTVTAKWEKIEYTVSFDAAGGTLAGDASAETADGKVNAPADPTREGYNFLGWYIGNEKVDFATKVFTADTTVTAKWEEIVVTTTTVVTTATPTTATPTTATPTTATPTTATPTTATPTTATPTTAVATTAAATTPEPTPTPSTGDAVLAIMALALVAMSATLILSKKRRA